MCNIFSYFDSGEDCESPVFRNVITRDVYGGELVKTLAPFPEAFTLSDLFYQSTRRYSANRSFADRKILSNGDLEKYVFLSYDDFHDKVEDFSEKLSVLGLKKSDKVAVFCQNCTWGQIVAFACYLESIIVVPIDGQLMQDSAEYIIGHADCKVVVVHKANLNYLKSILNRLQKVTDIIVIGSNEPFEILGNVRIWTPDNITANIENLIKNINNNNNNYNDDDNNNNNNNEIINRTSEYNYNEIKENDNNEMLENKENNDLTRSDFKDNKYKHINHHKCPPKPNDIALILYHSGSNGYPLGCILSHKNIIAGAAGLSNLGSSVSENEVYFSCLPLTHVYENCVEIILISQGSSIGFASGRPGNFISDIQSLQPTLLCGVPRFFNRIVKTLRNTISEMSGFERLLLGFAIKTKLFALHSNDSNNDSNYYNNNNHNNNHHYTSLFTQIFNFQSLADRLGGRVRLIATGGAPIRPDVFEFLQVTVTSNIIQGYGLTEASGCVSVDPTYSTSSVTHGLIAPCCEVKLKAVNGMDYKPRTDITTSCGEVFVRGPNVFLGYYKEDDLTKTVLSEDGWLKTGDIARIVASSGKMQIIDNVKNVIKLSQGLYISLSKLTEMYSRAQGVKNIFVYADSHLDFPIAVVVPTEKLINEWRKEGILKIQESKAAEMHLLRIFEDVARENHCRGFEKIKIVIIDNEEFTKENGLLNKDGKPCFHTLKKKYEDMIVKRLDRLTTLFEESVPAMKYLDIGI